MHHVARRFADLDLVVPVCRSCHLVLGALQDANGIPAGGQSVGPLDATRARLYGVLDVLTVRTALQGMSAAAALNAEFAQLAGHLVDTLGAADREGRFAPDPRHKVPALTEVQPVGHVDNLAAYLGGCYSMLGELARTSGSDDLADLVRPVVEHPEVLVTATAQVLLPAGCPALVAWMTRVVDLFRDLVNAHDAVQPTSGIIRQLGEAMSGLPNTLIAALREALDKAHEQDGAE
ncbi:hypothetical protein [Amycolatopsis dongchuanensis]